MNGLLQAQSDESFPSKCVVLFFEEAGRGFFSARCFNSIVATPFGPSRIKQHVGLIASKGVPVK